MPRPLHDIRFCREADIRSFLEPTSGYSDCTRHPEEADTKRLRLQSLVSARRLPNASKHVAGNKSDWECEFSWLSAGGESCVHCVIDIIQRTRATGPQSGT